MCNGNFYDLSFILVHSRPLSISRVVFSGGGKNTKFKLNHVINISLYIVSDFLQRLLCFSLVKQPGNSNLAKRYFLHVINMGRKLVFCVLINCVKTKHVLDLIFKREKRLIFVVNELSNMVSCSSCNYINDETVITVQNLFNFVRYTTLEILYISIGH